MENECTVCGSPKTNPLVEVVDAPVHCNLLWSTRDEALTVPRGDIRLMSCDECGHVFNVAFDPARVEYTQEYENSLYFSPRFQEYARSLVSYLVERYHLYDRDVLEIGCGRGYFLQLLCERGNNRGIGFDPSAVGPRVSGEAAERITIIQDYYSERYADYSADLICCRHVLEHLQHPTRLLSLIRGAIGDRSDVSVFFEVPNALFTLRERAIWDVIYEHCSYFSPSSLNRAFAESGFEVSKVVESFGGQFLCIEALPARDWRDPASTRSGATHVARPDAPAFASEYRRKTEKWQSLLDDLKRQNRRVVVWGAGSKGVTFLNAVRLGQQVECVVDINPRKHGKYVAGTGQIIVGPEYLRQYQPDVVIVMNPIYEDEIRRTTADLGFTPELIRA